jgi:hypothetical protein
MFSINMDVKGVADHLIARVADHGFLRRIQLPVTLAQRLKFDANPDQVSDFRREKIDRFYLWVGEHQGCCSSIALFFRVLWPVGPAPPRYDQLPFGPNAPIISIV